MKLNKEQQEFVTTSNCNVLVSASAGSGKTTTMIEKLLYLITKEIVPVNKLLVVTFTEDAAGEMKQKLFFKLQQYLIENDNATNKVFVQEQLDDINVADIGTIHSVCKKWITKYFYELNIDPAFGIIVDEENKSLFNDVLDRVFNKYIEKEDEEFYTVYESFNKKRNDIKFKSIITQLYNFIIEKQNVTEWKSNLTNVYETNINKNIALIYMKEYFQTTLKKHEKVFKDNLILAQELKLVSLQAYIEYILTHLNELDKVSDVTTFTTCLFEDVSVGRLYLSKKESAQAQDFFEELKQNVDVYKDEITHAKKCFVTSNESECVEIIENNKLISLKLIEIITNVNDEFDKLKRENSVLNFNDLQNLTVKLLENESIRLEIKNKYYAIFIDEYQDVNDIQEHIMQSISNNNNLFMIGDVKQSIYAFRQCNPKIFLHKYNNYKEKNSNNKTIELNENYRSTKKILDFCNVIFSEIMTKNTIGIDYKQNAKLIAGNDLLSESIDTNIEVCIKNKFKLDMLEDSEDVEDDVVQESEIVAKKISEVLGRDYFNIKQNAIKQINYKDIAVLSRDNSLLVYEIYKTLTNYKIPVNVMFYQNIFKSNEVLSVYSFLKLVNNFCDDVNVATALKSVVINITEEELAEIKQVSENIYFYDCVIQYNSIGKNEVIKNKINKLFSILKNLKISFTTKSIYETVCQFFEENDLENYYYSFPNGNEMINNLHEFLNLLNNKNYENNITKCVDYCDMVSGKDDFKINITHGSNAVQILTMHKSKGLEYPCVILCGLGKQFNTNVFKQDLVITNEFGIGLNSKDLKTRREVVSPIKNANKLLLRKSELEEQIRILYVALTRAQNYLYLVGTYSLENIIKKHEQNIYKATCFYDLVFKCLNAQSLVNFNNATENFNLVINSKHIADVNVYDKIIGEDIDYPSIKFSGAKEELVNKLKTYHKYVYQKNDTQVAIKNSVSGLLRENSDYESLVDAPRVFGVSENTYGANASLIGTMYHDVMSRLNYSETLQDVNNIIFEMKNEKMYNDELYLNIDSNKIYNAICAVKSLQENNCKILKEQQFLLQKPYKEMFPKSSLNENILVQGVVDLIMINGNKGIIIDFKTNKHKTNEQLKEMYGLQLSLYAAAVINGYNLEVNDKYIYSFENNSLIKL